MENERNEMRFDSLVYSIDGEYHVCDYIFLDYHGGHLTRKGKVQGAVFKGATGTVLEIITDYDGEDIWREMVHSGRYTGSLDDFNEEARNDDSNVYEEHHKDVKGYELKEGEHWDVRGGGRCFDATEMRRLYAERPEGLTIHDESLFKAIIAVESGTLDYIAEDIASLKISLDYESDTKKKTQLQNELRHLEGYLKQKSKRTR